MGCFTFFACDEAEVGVPATTRFRCTGLVEMLEALVVWGRLFVDHPFRI
jgi:hypothetical protein